MKIHALSTYRASCLKCVHRQCVRDVNDIPSNQLKKNEKSVSRDWTLQFENIVHISSCTSLLSAAAASCFQ